MDNKQYVYEIATVLDRAGATLPVSELAELLNLFGRKTTYDGNYEGLRGTYTLIHATYDWLTNKADYSGAGIVAKAFTKPDGTYAYQK